MDSIFNIILYPLDIFTTILDSTGTVPFLLECFLLLVFTVFFLNLYLVVELLQLTRLKLKILINKNLILNNRSLIMSNIYQILSVIFLALIWLRLGVGVDTF